MLNKYNDRFISGGDNFFPFPLFQNPNAMKKLMRDSILRKLVKIRQNLYENLGFVSKAPRVRCV